MTRQPETFLCILRPRTYSHICKKTKSGNKDHPPDTIRASGIISAEFLGIYGSRKTVLPNTMKLCAASMFGFGSFVNITTISRHFISQPETAFTPDPFL